MIYESLKSDYLNKLADLLGWNFLKLWKRGNTNTLQFIEYITQLNHILSKNSCKLVM